MPFKKGEHPSILTEFKKGQKLSEETKRKMSNSRKGEKHPFYGKHHSKEAKKKISQSKKGKPSHRKGVILSSEIKKKISDAKKGILPSKEIIRKRLQRRLMSSLEIKFNNIIQKHNLPYKFVGNGEFFIERKNPDFINTNGEKIAIEVFYKRHKLLFGQSKGKTIEDWKQERQSIFNKYGWKILFFDEVECREDNILKRIG